MMKNIIKALLATVFSGCLCCAVALAYGGAMGGGHRSQVQAPQQGSEHSLSDIAGVGEQEIRRMLSYKPELELTAQQESSLLAIRTELLKNLAVVVKSFMQCQGEYMAVVDAENPDFKAIRDKAREMTTIETYVTALSVDAFDKAFAVLNEKQKNIWAVLAKKRHDEMMARMMQEGMGR
jgi:Spy/CpxP family protein refolding chaperone